jgi:hypothetical protein
MDAYLAAGSRLPLETSEIAENEARHSFGGLYIEMPSLSWFIAESNIISANLAITESGGLHIRGTSPSQYYLNANKIVNNQAGMADGLSIWDQTHDLWGYTENNVIAGNQGDGVYLRTADFRSLNDTIADNTGYGIMMTGTVTATAWLSNTIIWGHAPGAFNSAIPAIQTMEATFSDIQGNSVWPGTGNIGLDPLFVGGGDYHLQELSPAIDKVEPALAADYDHDGVTRPVGPTSDMGAYEWFQTTLYIYLPLVAR